MKTIARIFAFGLVGLMLLLYIDNRETLQRATHRAAEITVTWWGIFLWALLIVAVISVFAILYLAYHRSYRPEPNRIRDGSAQLREYRIRKKFGIFGGVTLLVDPNLMQGAAALIGEHGYTEIAPIGEPVRLEVQRTRHLSAVYPGDAALVNQRMPRSIEMPKLNDTTRKLITNKPSASPAASRAEIVNPEPITPAQPVTMLATGNLQMRNTPTLLHLGQSPTTGEIAAWNVTEQPHIRLHGSSQGGKSSLARLIAVFALAEGWRVIVLDRRRFKDWSALAGFAELCDVSQPTALAERLAAIHDEYRRRDAILGQHAAPNIAAIPAGLRPTRTLVIVEEFGIQLVNAKAAGAQDKVLNALRPIAQEAGAAGIHLMMIDQLPTDWDRAVKANIGAVITFRQPENSGQAAGYWAAHQLKPYHFAMDGIEYKAAYIATDRMAGGLRQMGIKPPPPLLEGKVVRPFGGSDTPPSTTGSDHRTEPPNRTTEPQETDAQRRAKAMIDLDPSTRQVDLVNRLGVSKVYASELWHRYHPDGKDNSAPPAPPLPVDAFGRQQTVIDAADEANAGVLAEIRQAIQNGHVSVNKRK